MFKAMLAAIVAVAVACPVVMPAPAGAAPSTQPAEASGVSSLGDIVIGDYTFAVTQEGPVTPGKEATFALTLTKKPGAKDPSAVRVWVGTEDGKGSSKSKTHTHGDKMEAHVDVPERLPANSRLWIETEVGGKKAKGSVQYK